MPQDVELFAGTVSENRWCAWVKLTPKKWSRLRLWPVFTKWVLRLPQGYDTQIGDLGMQLSGGQRQLVGLARVFYGGPKFVILDEPNSNLDDAGERALIHALSQLKKSQVSTIMVTHKPSLWLLQIRFSFLRKGQPLFSAPAKVFQAMAAASAGRS